MRTMSFRLATAVALTATLLASNAFAAGEKSGTLKFSYQNTEIVKVIDDYAKASGQRFVIDPAVRGKITIINPTPIAMDEAFNQLSTALATNSMGIVTQDNVMMVKPARNIQRDSIPVVTELPPMRPERMVTYVIQLKYTSADEINKQLRILTSRDGELVPYVPTNSILVSDWTPNLHRIAAILKHLDVDQEQKASPRK